MNTEERNTPCRDLAEMDRRVGSPKLLSVLVAFEHRWP